ncbi:MAG: MnhB domain-containing protein [Acidimicrobiia bacterium]
MKRSVIVDVTARLILPSALLFALHLLLVGHDRPGGGFVGGLVAGAAVAFIYVAGGIDDVREVVPVRPWTILGGGLVLAAGVAVVPVLLGDPVMYKWKLEPSLPLLGDFKISSALVFDVGVSMVVIGLVFMVFEAFGDDEPPEFRGEVGR